MIYMVIKVNEDQMDPQYEDQNMEIGSDESSIDSLLLFIEEMRNNNMVNNGNNNAEDVDNDEKMELISTLSASTTSEIQHV